MVARIPDMIPFFCRGVKSGKRTMHKTHDAKRTNRSLGVIALSLMVAAGLGMAGGYALAQSTPPTEHKGLQVVSLGFVPEPSMRQQIGLSGYKLQLREVTIEPGGQIAKHSHAARPGVVMVTNGDMVEGRASGETVYSATDNAGLIEDYNTVHWVWNRGDTPARAVVCDIVPAS